MPCPEDCHQSKRCSGAVQASITLSTSRKRFCQMGEDCARLAIRARALRYSAITLSKSPRSVAALQKHTSERRVHSRIRKEE